MNNPEPAGVSEQQRAHLEAVLGWARQLRGKLSPLLDAHGDRVHFRPTSRGVTMVGLLHERPQRGLGGIQDLDHLRDHFEDLFARHCRDIDQGRPTCEKQLQSFLIREAYQNDRRLLSLNQASRDSGAPVELRFVTDELPLPTDQGKVVCDLLALRVDGEGHQIPVVIELKTERQLTRLVEQVTTYARLVDQQAVLFAQLYEALLGQPVSFAAPCERWIVWPAVGDREPRAAELAALGVRSAGYEVKGAGFSLRMQG